MKQITTLIILSLLLYSCGLNKTDDFDYVERTSTINKSRLSIGDEFKITLLLKNNDNEIKELTFYKDLSSSIEIWSHWYCDSEIQHAQPRIENRESMKTEHYLVKLNQGDSISFELHGKLLLDNDTLKVVFDKYNETLYLPNVQCDSLLTCEIHGMWIPGRPYLADSYEYYFNANTLIINNETE